MPKPVVQYGGDGPIIGVTDLSHSTGAKDRTDDQGDVTGWRGA